MKIYLPYENMDGKSRNLYNNTFREVSFVKFSQVTKRKKKSAPNNPAVRAKIKIEKKKKKLVHLGWKHYDPIKGKHVQVRGDRGGGTIKVRLDWKTDYPQLMQRMLETFFPEGTSPLGVLDDMNYSIGIYDSDKT